MTGNHPPTFCVSRSSDTAYYTVALPISIIFAIGISLIFLVLVIIFKVNSFYGDVDIVLHYAFFSSIIIAKQNRLKQTSILEQQRKSYYSYCAILFCLDLWPL